MAYLSTLDIIIILSYFAISIWIGFKFKNAAGKSLSEFFLGGRKLPWYLAGISMVATTFAADTPLWVAEQIEEKGISGNWLWWNMLIGGMLTTFFFAKLWRRAGVLTELEFMELRYSGKPAAFLRGFKAIYLGIILNIIVIGWVNAAFIKILEVFFDLQFIEAFWYTAGTMLLVAIYSSLSGLKGVVITDAIQFSIAMIGCVILAIVLLNNEKVGGITGLKAQLPAWRFEFFPDFSSDSISKGLGSAAITFGSFLTFTLVQWWASWYPGAEPGGGGYVAQRLMSAKDEKAAQNASLFFQITHYCLRPWPWIIVGLCILVLYPNIDDPGKGFIMSIRDYLSPGLKGLLLVAFFGAYMSTISTQLNWGSSFLTNDIFKRFIRPENTFKDEEEAQKTYVKWGRVFTFIILVFALLPSFHIKRINDAAQFLIQSGGGIGLVLILRWFWWRISAWSEISAIIGSMIGFIISNYVLKLDSPLNFLFTVGFTTLFWIIVTFITTPDKKETLLDFFKKVRPIGFWGKFRDPSIPSEGKSWVMFANWIVSIIFAYSILFLIGKLILQEWSQSLVFGVSSLLSLFVYNWLSKKE